MAMERTREAAWVSGIPVDWNDAQQADGVYGEREREREGEQLFPQSTQPERSHDLNRLPNVRQLKREYERGGLYRKLAMLEFVRARTRTSASVTTSSTANTTESSDVLGNSMQSGTRSPRSPPVQADIINAFGDLNPQATEVDWPQSESQNVHKWVYKVKLEGDMTVILKIVELLSLNTKVLNNLRREEYIGRTLGGLSPYIAQTYDYREKKLEPEHMQIEMLMEYGGESLQDCKDKLSTDEVLTVVDQLAEVLVFLEDRGVSHLDLKPSNIMWNRETRQIRLIDFGCSVSFYSTPDKIYAPLQYYSERFTAFTGWYAAPEVLGSNRSKDLVKTIIPQKADVFCFGMTVLSLLLPTMNPFCPPSRNQGEKPLHQQFVAALIQHLKSHNLWVWQQLFLSCLKYKPARRPTYHGVRRQMQEIVGILSTSSDWASRNGDQTLDEHAYRHLAVRYAALNEPEITLWHLHQTGYLERKENSPMFGSQSVREPTGQEESPGRQRTLAGSPHRTGDSVHYVRESENQQSRLEAAIVFFLAGQQHYSLSHYKLALEYYKKAENIHLASQDADYCSIGNIYFKIGQAHHKSGELSQALEHYLKAQRNITGVLGKRHSTMVELLTSMGSVYLQMGAYEDGNTCFSQARDIIMETGDKNNPELANVNYHWGQASVRKGELSQALELFTGAQKIWELTPQQHKLELAAVLTSIGEIYLHMQDYESALQNFKEARGIRRAIQGEDHLDAVRLDNAIGNVYYRQQRYTEALDCYQRAGQGFATGLGLHNLDLAYIRTIMIITQLKNVQHPNLAQLGELGEELTDLENCIRGAMEDVNNNSYKSIICINLGNVYMRLNEHYIARELNQLVIRMYEKGGLSDSLSLLTAYSNCGVCSTNLREYTSALAYFRKAEELWNKLDGLCLFSIATLYCNTGLTLCQMMDFPTAIEYFQKALHINSEKANRTNSNVLFINYNLAVLYREAGEYRTALGYLQIAKSIILSLPSVEYRTRCSVDLDLGLIYYQLGCYSDARKHYESVINLLDEGHNQQEPILVQAYLYLGTLETKTKNSIEAKQSYEKAKNIVDCLPVESDLRALVYKNLGIACVALKEYDEAIQHFNVVNAIIIDSNGQDHPASISVLTKLGFAYYCGTKYSEALEYFQRAFSIAERCKEPYAVVEPDDFHNAGLAASHCGQVQVAIEYYTTAIQIYSNASTDNSLKIAEEYSHIGDAYMAIHQFADALHNYEESVQIHISILGENQLEVVKLYLRIGCAAANYGDYERQRQYCQQAQRIITANHWEAHPYATALSDLMRYYTS